MTGRRRRVIAAVVAVVVGGLVLVVVTSREDDEEAALRRAPEILRPGRGAEPGVLLAEMNAGVTQAAVEGVLRPLGASVDRVIPGLGTLVIETGGPAEPVEEALVASGLLSYVEPNRLRTGALFPDDPMVRNQEEDLVALNLPKAWDRIKGDGEVVVAVADTGVDSDHPELRDHLVEGYDVVNRDRDPSDDHGHGTMCAGIVAALTDNGEGMAGAAWAARIMPVKVLDRNATGYDDELAEGIVWAADHGADIVNLSLAGYGASKTISRAVDRAGSRGTLLVAAAGNEGVTRPTYPAAARGVLSVAATDARGRRANFSNHGDWIDVAAPGVNIVATHPGNDYTYGTGTSFAAPLVVGVAVLVASADPRLGPDDLTRRLRDTARALRDGGLGRGMVDASRAAGGAAEASSPTE